MTVLSKFGMVVVVAVCGVSDEVFMGFSVFPMEFNARAECFALEMIGTVVEIEGGAV